MPQETRRSALPHESSGADQRLWWPLSPKLEGWAGRRGVARWACPARSEFSPPGPPLPARITRWCAGGSRAAGVRPRLHGVPRRARTASGLRRSPSARSRGVIKDDVTASLVHYAVAEASYETVALPLALRFLRGRKPQRRPRRAPQRIPCSLLVDQTVRGPQFVPGPAARTASLDSEGRQELSQRAQLGARGGLRPPLADDPVHHELAHLGG